MSNKKRNQIRKQTRKQKPSYCVFVEGETEKAYLNEFKKDLNNKIALTIKPRLKSCDLLCSNKKSVDDVIRELKYERQQGVDKVFYVFDKDVILTQDKNTPNSKYKPSEKLKTMKEKLKKCKNIVVLENSPCFELWLLLHFIFTASSFNNCDQVIRELKNNDNSYEKSVKEYEAIYKKYKDHLEDAINRARTLDGENIESKAQIYKMIEELKSKAGL